MERLAFPTRVLPEFGDRKHPNMSTEEEFAARKREERKREMRTKSLTFTDQLGMEAELFRALHSATAGQLADDLDQQILEQRSNTGTETGNRSVTGRSATRRSQDLARSFSNVAAAPAPPLTDQPRKRMRNGGEENGSPNGVVSAALKEYARQIPEDNTAGRGILNALLEMIDRRLVSDEALSREVPRALQELRTEHPGLANIPYRAVLDAVGFTGEI
jgi:hypothetical protein